MQSNPSFEPAEVVPEGYRVDRLPTHVREWVDRQTDFLAEAFDIAYGESGESGEDLDYHAREESILTNDRLRWWGSESERTVAGLGRTFRGEPIRDDHTGVVLKFNPWLRAEERSPVTSFSNSGNLHELSLWRHAVESGDESLFGTILDYSDDGAWLAMREYIPIYRYKAPRHEGTTDYLSEDATQADYVESLDAALRGRGYDAHLKDGNVGLATGGREEPTAVLIDYGAHVKLTDDTDLDDYLPERR